MMLMMLMLSQHLKSHPSKYTMGLDGHVANKYDNQLREKRNESLL